MSLEEIEDRKKNDGHVPLSEQFAPEKGFHLDAFADTRKLAQTHILEMQEQTRALMREVAVADEKMRKAVSLADTARSEDDDEKTSTSSTGSGAGHNTPRRLGQHSESWEVMRDPNALDFHTLSTPYWEEEHEDHTRDASHGLVQVNKRAPGKKDQKNVVIGGKSRHVIRVSFSFCDVRDLDKRHAYGWYRPGG